MIPFKCLLFGGTVFDPSNFSIGALPVIPPDWTIGCLCLGDPSNGLSLQLPGTEVAPGFPYVGVVSSVAAAATFAVDNGYSILVVCLPDPRGVAESAAWATAMSAGVLVIAAMGAPADIEVADPPYLSDFVTVGSYMTITYGPRGAPQASGHQSVYGNGMEFCTSTLGSCWAAVLLASHAMYRMINHPTDTPAQIRQRLRTAASSYPAWSKTRGFGWPASEPDSNLITRAPLEIYNYVP